MTPPIERRATRRRRAQEYGIVRARVRPGHSAHVVDVSAGGALIETHFRLLPDAAVELQMETDRQHISVRGRVVRCAVARLRPAVCYRGAIVFDRRLSWLVDGHEYRLPVSDSADQRAVREGLTHDAI